MNHRVNVIDFSVAYGPLYEKGSDQ